MDSLIYACVNHITVPRREKTCLRGFRPGPTQTGLSLFGNVTRQEKSSTEQQLALRQLTVKSLNSHSWFIAVKKLLVKYGLSDPMELLENPPTKYAWKRRVNKQINEHWTCAIKVKLAFTLA